MTEPETTSRLWASATGIGFVDHSGCTIEIPDSHLAELGYHKQGTHDRSRDIPGAPDCASCGYSMGLTTDQDGTPRWVCDSTNCPNRGVLFRDTCGTCDGTGTLWDGSFYVPDTVCEACDGSGKE